MKLAEEYVLGNLTECQRDNIQRELAVMNPNIYLHFCVFKVVAYISVNYNKQINEGVFNFVKQKQVWTMSCVEAATISNLSCNKFTKADLWINTPANFTEFKEEGEHAML